MRTDYRYYPELDPTEHYARSQKNLGRIPLNYLRAFADTPPAQAAIARISDGVTGMPWSVSPPGELRNNEEALKTARAIEEALLQPNYDIEGNDTYTLVISAIITDLLIQNVAAVERQPGDLEFQPFSLWVTDPNRLHRNLDWEPQLRNVVPRYYDTQGKFDQNEWREIFDDDLFIVKRYANSWRINPPGPLEVAFKLVAAWLGLGDYQQLTTSRASQEYIIDLGQVSDAELQAFRVYFDVEVLQNKKTGIFGRTQGGEPIKVVKTGASTDEGLYLKYQECLLRIIALAFRLSARDMNIPEPDNRATADVAADATFNFAILPMAKCIFERFQRDVVRFFFPGFQIRLADTQPRDQLKEAQTSEIMFQSGLATQNEARLDAGKTSLGPTGDVFVDGRTLDAGEDDDSESKKQKKTGVAKRRSTGRQTSPR